MPYFLKFSHDSHFTSNKIKTLYHSTQGSSWSVPSFSPPSSHTMFPPCSLYSSNTSHLSHQIITQLRVFEHALPLPGVLAPTPHSPPFFFVRLTSSGLRLKVMFLTYPYLRRSSVILSCNILCLHAPSCSDFVCFHLGSLSSHTIVSFTSTEAMLHSFTS